MDQLFTPNKIGGLKLENRIIMTAIHTGMEFETLRGFLVERAKGGAAYLTTVMGVSSMGAPSNMMVLERENLANLKRLTSEIHAHGGRLFIQLFHAGRNNKKTLMREKEKSPVAPSEIPSPIYKEMPHALNVEEIAETVLDFGYASALCKEAGVDGVEISCSAGYLLNQFFSPLTNRRTDNYGGCFENFCRFPLEVVEEVRNAVGKDYPVIIRVSAGDMLGGYGIQETIAFLKKAEPFLDGVNVTGGWHESPVPQISMQVEEGGFAYLAKEVKEAISLPVIGCNRINNGEIANKLLEEGYCDFVGCARAFLVDAHFANHIKEGKLYRRCIGCNRGCIEKVLKGQQVTCIFNPYVGHEGETYNTLHENETKKQRILVVGGGPAGMEAAITLGKRGHTIRICNKENHLGGSLYFAAKVPHKQTVNKNIFAMEQELRGLGVEICLGVSVDQSYILKYNPDQVILATGSSALVPSIPGLEREKVIFNKDILDGSQAYLETMRKGKVVIIGGGPVGLEMASFLSTESTDITVLELSKEVGKALGGDRRAVLAELASKNVKIMTETQTVQVKEETMLLRTPKGDMEIPYDTLVVAIGYEPEGRALFELLQSTSIPVSLIGDAKQIGDIGAAILSGFNVQNSVRK